MAIRDRFRRALHKSDSDSNISQVESNITTTTTTTTNTSSETSSEPSSLHRQPTQQKLTFPWGRTEKEREQRKEEKEKKKQKKKASGKPMHPRDKPLTATNLRHQEMLGQFDFSFGSSPNRLSQLVPAGPMDHIGVSPCCTRPASINGDTLTPLDEESDREPATSTAEPPKVAVTVPE